MTLVLDAGALVALERGDRAMLVRFKRALADGDRPVTHGGVVGQVWRGGSGRQAPLAVALKKVRVLPLDEALGKRAGALLAAAGTRDAVDAAVVGLATDGDVVATSDPDDIGSLIVASGRRVLVANA